MTKTVNPLCKVGIAIAIFLSLTIHLFGGIGTIDSAGWTVLTPSGDSRQIYVSSSGGDDDNDGLSEASALATIDAADALIRDGYPDWILLKRGDTFAQPNLGRWKNGRSAEEPMVLTYYGDSGPRPVIKLTGAFVNWNGQARNHQAFVGLDLYRSISDPGSPDFTNAECGNALIFIAGANNAYNLLVEDCRMRYCAPLPEGQRDTNFLHNVYIRRNIVMNMWAHGTTETDTRVQGMFVRGVVDVYLEENVFHHNGWSEVIAGAGANQFNHNIYMSVHNDGDIVVRGNILSYGAAHGLQLRSGGYATMNAFVGNAISMNIGYPSPPAFYFGPTLVADNVVTDGRPQIPDDTSNPQTGAIWGIWRVELNNVPTVNDNIVANIGDTRGVNMRPFNAMTANELGTGNIAWNWTRDDEPAADPGWLDPTRNGDSYAASLGMNNWAGFMQAVTNRPVHQMPFDLTAYAYNNYVRAGFDKGAVTPPYTYDANAGIAVTGVVISRSSLTMEEGGLDVLTASVTPTDASNPTVQWSSSNPAVATVDSNGTVRAITEGTTIVTVTANDGGFQATCTVTVANIDVTAVSVAPTSASLGINETLLLEATLTPVNPTVPGVVWTSANPAVAAVDGNGVVTGVGAGSTVITVTTDDGGLTATCTVTVTSTVVPGIGSVDADGWTILTPSPDSRMVYVSSSEGDNNFDGLSPSTPKATIDAANALIRDGFPDWMLLKRGDTFPQPNLGRWKNGRGVNEPMVMTYYGETGARPVIKLTQELIYWNGEARNHLAFVGLDLYRSISDPDSPDFTNTSCDLGFSFNAGNNDAYNLLVEDCRLRYCWLIPQGQTSVYFLHNVHIRRNIVMNTWAHGTTEVDNRIQGMFVRGVVDVRLEENLFHHNGWSEVVAGAGANQYNHNIYMSVHNDGEIIVRGNILSYGAAHGLQLRSGGYATMNAFVGNAISMNVGYSSLPAFYDGPTYVADNVVTDGRPQIPDDSSSPQTGAIWGIWRVLLNTVPTIDDNIVANIRDTRGVNMRPFNAMTANELGTGNIAWNWTRDDEPSVDPGWLEPTRNADSFGASLGLTDWAGFIAAASNRPVHEMPFNLTAYAYDNYIRAGFNKGIVAAPYNYSGAPGSVAVTGVSLAPATLALEAGGTQALTATLSPLNATNQAVVWTSSAPGVATVSPSGLVTGVADGSATITVTTSDGGFTANTTVTVSSAPGGAVTGVSVSPTSLSFPVGQVQQLFATVSPANATDPTVTWSTSAPTVATVDANGFVTAVATGTATITATTNDGGFTASAVVAATAAPTGPAGVLFGFDLNNFPGFSSSPTATWDFAPFPLATTDVAGSFSHAHLATVVLSSGPGWVAAGTSSQAGFYRFPFYPGSPDPSDDQAASDAYVEFTINPAAGYSFTLAPTNTLQFNKRVYDSDGSAGLFVRSSLDNYATNLASLTGFGDGGVVSFDLPGFVGINQSVTFRIYVYDADGVIDGFGIRNNGNIVEDLDLVLNGTMAVATVPVSGVSLAPASVGLAAGQTQQLVATVAPANASDPSVVWSSSDPAIATVDTSGVVTAVMDGAATITVTTTDGGFTATTSVTVAPPVSGGVLVGYDMDSFAGFSSTPAETWDYAPHPLATTDVAGSATASNLTTVVLSAGPGWVAAGTNSQAGFYRFRAYPGSADPTSDTVASDAYFEFTLDPAAGYAFTLDATDTLQFRMRVYDNDGTAGFFVRSSVDNYASNLASLTGFGDSTTLSFDLPGFANVESAVTFRVYVYDADGDMGGFSLRNGGNVIGDYDFVINGSVNAATVPVSGVSVAPGSVALAAGQTQQLVATVAPANASDSSVVWSSSDPAIATVDTSGVVTAVTTGGATITVTTTDGGFTATTSVTVAPPAPGGVLVGYDMDSFAGFSSTPTETWDFAPHPLATTDVAGSATAANLATVVLSAGPGWVAAGTNAQAGFYRFRAYPGSADPINDTAASDAYVEFTLDPADGYGFTLDATDTLQFRMRVYDNDGTAGIFVRSSVDNYASNLASLTGFGDSTTLSFDLPGFANVESAVTFRVYVYDADGDMGGFSLRNGGNVIGDYDFVLNGAVNLAGGAGAGGGGETESSLAIVTESLGAGTVGETYTAQIETVGGAGDQAFDLASGALPVGLVLGSDGMISGQPMMAGIASFVLRVADLSGVQTREMTLNVSPGTAAVALSDLSFVYDGTSKSATVTTSPAGLSVGVVYAGNPTSPSHAGSYAVVATVMDANYVGSAAGTLTITAAPATVTLHGLGQSYDGTPREIGVDVVPDGLPVIVGYAGEIDAPRFPGSYEVVAVIDDPNYTGSASGVLKISTGALIRRGPTLNGDIDGSVQVTSAQSVTLNGGASISGDLLMPGTPEVLVQGNALYVGTQAGPGASDPTGHKITLNGNAVTRYIVTQIDPVDLPVVFAPPAPTGTANITLNTTGQNVPDWTVVRSLTLNGNAGVRAVPPGNYDRLTANGNSGFVLGIAGSTEPAVYGLQNLTLNGNSAIQLVGSVVLTLANGVSLNGNVGHIDQADWLTVNIHSGGLTLNGGVMLHGSVVAPNGTVTINGNSAIHGKVVADQLTINGNGYLQEP
ncbi:Ig-like domain-containing protein [Synoicihabitans lomoniglobus]|uniref:Ig-like domain-containing protein n=1 Tax=Synoicihabitans lomoniglobus TaxID=2909285 RepID=A0AAF0CP03_9BACT|nr:Ig-like domain-containing protein [Opitutaceae bacterium LMO-M01]WED63184.1 Ig-like domain-containing protein [Opitutaceae bacterium LMO-M01]